MAEHVRKICFQSRKASSCKGITSDERSRPIDLIFLIVSLVFVFSLSLHRQAASQDNTPVADQLIGGEFSYVVRSGDSLTGIGARFGVNVGALTADNNLVPEFAFENRTTVACRQPSHRTQHRQRRDCHQHSAAYALLFQRAPFDSCLFRWVWDATTGLLQRAHSRSSRKKKIRSGMYPYRFRTKCGAKAKP